MALLSAIITFFFIHPLSHDGMEQEDIAFREYLEANGWDTSQMGLLTDEEVRSIEEKRIEGDQSNASISGKEAA
jgi:hypothetical protein